MFGDNGAACCQKWADLYYKNLPRVDLLEKTTNIWKCTR